MVVEDISDPAKVVRAALQDASSGLLVTTAAVVAELRRNRRRRCPAVAAARRHGRNGVLIRQLTLSIVEGRLAAAVFLAISTEVGRRS
jgi:hypothetical protein